MTTDHPVRVRLEQDADFAFRVSFPDTDLDALLTDEPSPMGHDRGPDPLRILLTAIGNCLVASLLFALRKHRNAPGTLIAEVSASPARNEKGRLRVPRASVRLHLPGTAADYHNLDRVLAQFEDFCTVTQSIRQGVEVDLSVLDGEGNTLT